MKIDLGKFEPDLLRVIQHHTGCSKGIAVGLLADIKHLANGNHENMKFNVTKNKDHSTDTKKERKRGFL